MFSFFLRRSSAATEGLVLATVLATVGALTGLTAISQAHEPDDSQSLAAAVQGTELVEGVLSIRPAEARSDGTHWTAILDTGTRTFPVAISHEDSHRTELAGARVQVQGTWTDGNTFAAAAIEVIERGKDSAGTANQSPAKKGGRARVLEGTLSQRHGDDFGAAKTTRTRYYLLGDAGETEVEFDRTPASALAGARVRLTGVMTDNRLRVGDDGTTVLAAGGGSAGGGGGGSGGGSTSTGSKRVAVVLFNFSNEANEPYSRAFAEGIAFTNTNSVAAYYAESSWSQLTLTGDVYGWYTIPESNSGCSTSTWSSSANAAAAAAGVTLSSYDHVVYAFPYAAGCSWSGLATMPGRSSWLNGTSGMTVRSMAHELGHNFGTHHASTANCVLSGVRVSLAAPSDCSIAEYGDPFTVMGSATQYLHTSYSRGNLAWLRTANTATITESGEYTLKPIGPYDSANAQVLRIQRSTGVYLYLEYRQPLATFDTFSMTSPVVNGVSVRISGAYTTLARSQLVDATPTTATYSDAALVVGGALFDPVSGVAMTTLSVSSSGAVVQISFDGAPVPTASPSASPDATPSPTPTPTPTPSPTESPSPTPTSSPDPTPTTPPDAEPPTAPSNLVAAMAKGKKVSLFWSPSTDNVAVSGYRVFRDGRLVAETVQTSLNDSLGRSRSATYQVVAFDPSGNLSAPSAPVVAAP